MPATKNACSTTTRRRPKRTTHRIPMQRSDMLARVLAAALVVCAPLAGACAGDADIGLAFLEQGKVREAAEYCRRAYQSDSTKALNALAYATTLWNADRAAALYQRVAGDQNADATLRGEALMRLGGMQYARGGYETAYDAFDKAWRMHPSPEAGRFLARAAINKGDLVKAEALLVPVASGDNRAQASHASYLLGNVHFLGQEYDKALTSYSRAARMEDAAHRAPSIAGAALSASMLERKKLARGYRDALAAQYDFYLESRLVDSVETPPLDFEEQDIAARADFSAAAESAGRDAAYTLQVGAFASLANARKLWRTLRKDFDNVTISALRREGKTLHRVRVGSFATEEQAREFGTARLQPGGMTYRVTRK
ncbi:MAG: hypothetical protein GF418_13990 [Chitinivibrionales bacterium]|nr:hypothetical protein [Chitinivibrionales bacterium]MBD3396729.1 hypothetical protein [Chitinivibrionales bacterium]